MGLNKYTKEQIEKMPLIDLAVELLAEEKKEMNFIDLFNLVAEQKEFSEAQKKDYLARFYTELNVDGRFMTLGKNVWTLKRWQPVNQTSEKALAEVRKREAEVSEETEEAEYLAEDDELYEEETDDEAAKELYEDVDYA